MEVRDKILNTLRKTARENIEMVIDYMLKHEFFTRSCHKHHRYVGGLADHAWQTYQIALSAAEKHNTTHSEAEHIDLNSVAIASLLHDFCNCSGMRSISGHGGRSSKMLKAIGLHLSQQEFLAIRFHMSLRNKANHFLYQDALHSTLRYIVHDADGKSARMHRGAEVKEN